MDNRPDNPSSDFLPPMPKSPEPKGNNHATSDQHQPLARRQLGTPPGSPPPELRARYAALSHRYKQQQRSLASTSPPPTSSPTFTNPTAGPGGSNNTDMAAPSGTVTSQSSLSSSLSSLSTTAAQKRPSPPKSPGVVIEERSSEYANATLKFCTVCAANNNRSMEAHRRLSVYFPTISFGTGSLVRLPGPSVMEPNVYKFNVTSYADIYRELEGKDPWLYKANGLLPMLARNKAIKWGPERWQDWAIGMPRVGPRFANDLGSDGTESGVVDVVITCEARCWDAVVEDLHARGGQVGRPIHVINVDIKDTHEEAVVGAGAILDLATRLDRAAKQSLGLPLPSSSKALPNGGGEDGDDRQREWNSGGGSARQGFDDKVPIILAEWQEVYPNLPAMWTVSWL